MRITKTIKLKRELLHAVVVKAEPVLDNNPPPFAPAGKVYICRFNNGKRETYLAPTGAKARLPDGQIVGPYWLGMWIEGGRLVGIDRVACAGTVLVYESN